MARAYFFWDPLSDNILQERDATGAVTAEYTTEPGLYGNLISQNRQGTERQYHFDALGSTLALTDDDQQVIDTTAYTAFGEVTEHNGSTVNPFQYIGQKGYYRDGTIGDYLVRQRAFCQRTARWYSPDPAFSIPQYAYASQNPLRLLDPSGLYILDLSPLLAKGAPWCKVGCADPHLGPHPVTGDMTTLPGDPNGLRRGVFGDTKPIKYDIACACQCINLEGVRYHQAPPLYKICCILWSYLLMRIAPDNFVRPATLQGVYGHEQRHIRNFLDVLHAQADTHVKNFEDDIYSSFAYCQTMAAILVSFVKDQLKLAEAREESHSSYLPGATPEPERGKMYAPIGNMPPKPDCTKPGKPKYGPPVDKPCCDGQKADPCW